jgi:DNA (cytosine-5)-methyltransferase 1
MPHGNAHSSGPTLVSLFTGAGGLDIGLELAGLRTVSAVDSDADCAATLRLNQERTLRAESGVLIGAKVMQAKVEDLVPKDLVPVGADSDWSPDVVVGGPPCQPFSSAGRMLSLKDPRGRLFEHFVRLAKGLKPRLVLFENVRGLVTAIGPNGRPGEALTLVKESFESIGYATTFALLNAADYGLPQRRVRLFMMATRNTVLPTFPSATNAENAEATLFGRQAPWATLGDFLKTMPPADDVDVDVPSPALRELLKNVPAGSGLKSAGAREATRPGGHWGYKQGTFVADPSKPARTVTAAATQDWIRDAQGRLRRLTWRECAALQGFPADWQFVGNKASRFRQIGNAVPVIFGCVLGEALLRVLGDARRVSRPASAPLPAEFAESIDYTRREHRRNGPSRAAAKAALAAGRVTVAEAKGLGSAECEEDVPSPQV